MFQMSIWEVNYRTYACISPLFVFREMGPVFKAQNLHGVIGKTQDKIHIAVTQREVQLQHCIC